MKGLRRTTLRARIIGCLMFAVMTVITASCAVPAFMATAEATGSYGAGAGAAAGVCIVLAGVFYCADALRRKYTTEMPVRRILAATERMMKGDFAVTLKPRHEWGKYDEFDLIAENVSRMAEELSRTETLRADFVCCPTSGSSTSASPSRAAHSVLPTLWTKRVWKPIST